MTQPLLELHGLKKHFYTAKGGLTRRRFAETVFAVDGIDLAVYPGETIGLVGESGCGKTTFGRVIVRLHDPTAGQMRFDGREVTRIAGKKLKTFRRHVQLIFQDPYDSLNPLMSVRSLIEEPLRLHRMGDRTERRIRVQELLRVVGLDETFARRRPRELSGGQSQRVGIARALAVEPRLIVCDEPVSALDVAIRAQITNLLQDLQDQLGLTYIFISHDLGLVEHLADRVVVMYLGRVVEEASTERIFGAPHHPYTEALLSANPSVDPREERRRSRIVLPGDPPSPVRRPTGCHFHPRCPIAQDVCRNEEPPLRLLESGHLVACHFAAPCPVSRRIKNAPAALAPEGGMQEFRYIHTQ